MDFRTIGDTTNPTLLTYNVAVTRTKASVLVDAPPEYLGADPTNEDGGTYLEVRMVAKWLRVKLQGIPIAFLACMYRLLTSRAKA